MTMACLMKLISVRLSIIKNKKTSLTKIARAVPVILVFIAVAMVYFQSTVNVRVQTDLR